MLQWVYAEFSFVPTKETRFIEILAEEEGKSCRLAQALLLFSFNAQTKDKKFRDLAFLNCFVVTPFKHFGFILRCPYLRWSTRNQCDHFFTPNPRANDVFYAG